ncbi:MAG TPA: RNA-directed DNA polymerase [Chitinophagaceae bacterium]|jgi:hypothetical protein|nr:RNA-directed DNA polymerase [Chitinophagaceae bacterium]
MTKEDFIKTCSDKKFWQWIKNKSLVSYGHLPAKEAFLKDLEKQILNRNYYPSPPKEYLTLNKGHGVVRTIPVLKLEDLCVYYYCVRKLEKYIALNHVPGTFGGFGLSGKLRHVEEEELNKALRGHDIIEFDQEAYVFNTTSGYPELSSFNPKAWYAEWNDFTKKLYFNSADFTSGFVAELDISNFYDSIQLDNLEFKLRKYIPHRQNEVIYLLMHFLRFWNRHINFYRQQGAGIPQDLFGECSRILANFYLQGYDKRISLFTESKNARFFRYADDQIVFANSKKDLEEIIAKASSLLMKEGLNFNQKKVNIMTIRQFKKYYSFDNFFALAQKKGIATKLKELEKQIIFYLTHKSNLRKKGTTLLKRILNVSSKIRNRPKNFVNLKKHLVSEEFLLNTPMQVADFMRIYELLNKREKAKMYKLINASVENCYYSDRLYNIKKFFTEIGKPIRPVKARITWVKKFYQFNH